MTPGGAAPHNGCVAEHCFTVTLRRGGAISTVLDVPKAFEAGRTPVVVLAHGAGAGMRHPFMEFFATELSERGLCVVRFNFPYMETGTRRPPDPMGVLLDAYHEVVAASAQRTGSPPGPIFLGGKSMGGRVALGLVEAKRVTPSGLVFLGFPLHKAGDAASPRLAGFATARRPMLFVQGTRDPLCHLPLLETLRKQHRLSGSLHVVESGDHSFALPAAERPRQEAELGRVADVVAAFVRKVLERS